MACKLSYQIRHHHVIDEPQSVLALSVSLYSLVTLSRPSSHPIRCCAPPRNARKTRTSRLRCHPHQRDARWRQTLYRSDVRPTLTLPSVISHRTETHVSLLLR